MQHLCRRPSIGGPKPCGSCFQFRELRCAIEVSEVSEARPSGRARPAKPTLFKRSEANVALLRFQKPDRQGGPDPQNPLYFKRSEANVALLRCQKPDRQGGPAPQNALYSNSCEVNV